MTTWACPDCHTINGEDADACVACGFERVKLAKFEHAVPHAASTDRPSPMTAPPTPFSSPNVPPPPAPIPADASAGSKRRPVAFTAVVGLLVIGVGIGIANLLSSRTYAVTDTTTSSPLTTTSDVDPSYVSAPSSEPTTPSTLSVAPAPTTPIANPGEAYRDHIVAVLWSDFGSIDRPVVSRQLDVWRQQFGGSVIALAGNWYRSLRDGTAAVAYDGTFSSVRAAAQWCSNNGLAGAQGVSCFGVILNDQFSENDKGEGQGRFYPANL